MPTILITGASGFIGQLLATHLLTNHATAPENKLILTDIITPSAPSSPHPQNIQCIQADLCNAESLSSLLSSAGTIDTIFISTGIMSFRVGAKFRARHERIRNTPSLKPEGKLVRVIYASSLAVYGRPLPEIITRETHPTPEGSYGCQKLACETLLQDYIAGDYRWFGIAFPTIVSGPGKPTQAGEFVSERDD
ncbi:uncharacterized protein EAF02_003790 [Botrytis sinoallii]|uniref:uncharacterized protein n=1 Tax=Botrytis sinoallii TaxID=1463999 RepID=UPI0018FF8593|nr:uncharacterized protein EAF02_003790 [Botrytis sinoallii]KAF7887143.1 hypothetical protein EAF02_003790 [Botrytis sinoallii]